MKSVEIEKKEIKAEKNSNFIIIIELLLIAITIGVLSFFALDKVAISDRFQWISSVFSGPLLGVLAFLGDHFEVFNLKKYLKLQKLQIKDRLIKNNN